jgi:hypothetical protein
MKEQVVLDYFKNKVSVEALASDLKGSRQSKGSTFSLDVEPLRNEGSFIVTRTNLIQLCNEVINGELSFEDLNTIAFVVLCSDFIGYDETDRVVDRVLDDWNNPDIRFPLTLVNMKKWKELLEFELDTFNMEELNQKKD